MATVKGVGCNWGLVGLSATGAVTGAFTSMASSKTADSEEIRNAAGDVVTKVYYNARREGTLEYIVTGSSASSTVTVTTPDVGTVITLSHAQVVDITGSYLVDAVDWNGTSTSAVKVTLKISAYPAITS